MTQAEVVCANAGDSRAILCRAGKPVELSHDHKPNDEGERRRIEAVGGRVEEIRVGPRVHHRVNGNLNLSRAIGDLEYKKQPELGPERQMICSTPDLIAVPRTQEDEFIVLACDGIWDVKSNQDVCDFVGPRLKRGEAITAIAEALLDDCIASDPKQAHGLGGDNMTVVIVQFTAADEGGGAPS
jgi:protein phosphatase 1G